MVKEAGAKPLEKFSESCLVHIRNIEGLLQKTAIRM